MTQPTVEPGHPLFVYGTLKRGGINHHHLAAQHFVGPARTGAGYAMYDLGGYPGLVAEPTAPGGITGEIWAVDAVALAELDHFEGVGEGLYRRESIRLSEPPGATVDAYVYARPIADMRRLGDTYPVDH